MCTHVQFKNVTHIVLNEHSGQDFILQYCIIINMYIGTYTKCQRGLPTTDMIRIQEIVMCQIK